MNWPRCSWKRRKFQAETSYLWLGGGFIFFFTPTWGRFPFWLICFRSVETTNQMSCVAKPLPVKSGHQEAFMFTPLKKLTPGTWKRPLGKGETSTNPSILGFHVSFWVCVGDPEKKTFDLPLLPWGVEHRNISVDFLWGEQQKLVTGGGLKHFFNFHPLLGKMIQFDYT